MLAVIMADEIQKELMDFLDVSTPLLIPIGGQTVLHKILEDLTVTNKLKHIMILTDCDSMELINTTGFSFLEVPISYYSLKEYQVIMDKLDEMNDQGIIFISGNSYCKKYAFQWMIQSFETLHNDLVLEVNTFSGMNATEFKFSHKSYVKLLNAFDADDMLLVYTGCLVIKKESFIKIIRKYGITGILNGIHMEIPYFRRPGAWLNECRSYRLNQRKTLKYLLDYKPDHSPAV